MITSRGATTVCKVDKVNSVGVNDGKGLGATLRVCAWFDGVVAKLEEVTCLPERGFLEV